jgi:hypothetical protein
VPRTISPPMSCLACRHGANSRVRRFGRHSLAVVAEAQDIVQLQLANAEKGSGITTRKDSVGATSGTWISRMRLRIPAPSMAAASMSDLGIACRAARKKMKL